MFAVDLRFTFNALPGMEARGRAYAERELRVHVDQTIALVGQKILTYGLIESGTMLGSTKGRVAGLEGTVYNDAVSEDGFPYPVVQNDGSVHVPATGFWDEAMWQAAVQFPDRFDRMGQALVG